MMYCVILIVTLTEYDIFTEIYITELESFQQNICNGCGMPTGDADSSGHLVPSLWDLHMFYLLRPILCQTCRYFTGLCSSNIPRYFLDFALRDTKQTFLSNGYTVSISDLVNIVEEILIRLLNSQQR